MSLRHYHDDSADSFQTMELLKESIPEDLLQYVGIHKPEYGWYGACFLKFPDGLPEIELNVTSYRHPYQWGFKWGKGKSFIVTYWLTDRWGTRPCVEMFDCVYEAIAFNALKNWK